MGFFMKMKLIMLEERERLDKGCVTGPFHQLLQRKTPPKKKSDEDGDKVLTASNF